jgi:F-type H+-transporting ATPase subunit b
MEQLGIQPSLLLAQIVNFVIIAVVLTKLLYKPILSMLEKRKKEIEAGLELTEKMRTEEEKLKVKQDKILEAARMEAREMLEKAKKDAANEEKEIIAQAHVESTQLIEKAKVEIDRLHAEMRQSVNREAVRLAEAMTIQITKSMLTSEVQHKLIAQQVKNLAAEKVR